MFSEFLKALKTPTQKDAGWKNSEFSEKFTFLTYFGHFWMKKSLTNIYQNLFLKSFKRFSYRLDEVLRRSVCFIAKIGHFKANFGLNCDLNPVKFQILKNRGQKWIFHINLPQKHA